MPQVERTSADPARAIRYTFFTAGRPDLTVGLLFDSRTHRLLLAADAPRPDWARLDCHRCPNCTLDNGEDWCPAALGLATILPDFSGRLSHEAAVIEVGTANRTVVTKTTLQAGLASLMGLICATSGCPLTKFLRPMARFHLPFASRQETLFRAASSYMLMQYFLHQEGKPCDMEMRALQEDYLRVSQVNRNMAARLREAVHGDANVNAVVLLDLFAQDIPMAIDEGLADLAKLFRPVLDAQEKKELPGV